MAEQLIFIQETFLDTIIKDHEELLSMPDSDKTEHKLKAFLKTLESDFNDSRKYHTNILKLDSEDDEAIVKDYLEKGIMNRIRSHYHSYWADLSLGIDSKVNASVLSSTRNSSNEDSKPYKIKLPTLDIKPFDGNYEMWPNFYNLFTSTIDTMKGLDNVQRLQYLLQSVEGEARGMIKDLPFTDESYDVAKEILKEQYNHKRKIAHVLVKKLLDYPPLKIECAKDLRHLLSTIKKCVSSLEQLSLPVKEWDYLLLCIMQQKIPTCTYREWEKKLGGSREVPQFDDFKKFLEETFRMLEMVEPPQKTVVKQKTFHLQTEPKKSSAKSTNKNLGKGKKCVLCKADHGVSKCQKFLNSDHKQRLEIQKSNKLCMNCLGVNHSAEKCYSFKSCIYCARSSNKTSRHHSLLHDHTSNNEEQSQETPNLNFHTINSGVHTAALLATAQVRLINNNGFSITLRALIDPCSEDNYITNNSCQVLALPKYENPCSVSGIGDTSIINILYRTGFDIQSMDGQFNTRVDAAVTKKISQLIPSEPIPASACGFLNNMALADPKYNQPGEVHLLLGIGVYAKVIQPGLQKFGTSIYAQKTLLGWIIGGQTEKRNDRPTSRMVFMTKSNKDEVLSDQLKKFWEVEEVPYEIPMKPEDKLCEEKFMSSINQRKDSRLAIDLPFRHSDQPIIGPSKDIALKRFYNLEKRLNTNEQLKTDYHANIREYIDSGHMIPVKTANDNGGKEYFLPHHPVIKEASTTTKVRVVFDASCKSSDGMSLNDHLMTGPKLQTDIRDIIFNWRKYKFAYTADIARMYRMFWLNEKHQQYQKILWRFDSSEPVKEYQLTTVTFGVNCAPYLAIRALHYIADTNQHKPEFQSICKSIKSEFYVDDFLSGSFQISDAINKQKKLRELFNQYGLNIRKWCSNEVATLEGIPPDHQELKTELNFDETDFRKTLGIYWTPINDYFKFSIDKECSSNLENLTKRKALSLISRLYDPMGWASPCTMFAKVLMQEIWKTKTGWDEQVCDSIKEEFLIFFSELHYLEKIEIPRWVNLIDEHSPVTLIGFCDASWKGYGAVVYLKINQTDSSKQTENNLILLASKTKVSPINFSSIPRLELCGALLLSELIGWAKKLLEPRKVEVVTFSDSQVVLHWLRSHPSKWKPYVASRTSKILENVPSEYWFYVHTSKNPADLASKGVLPSQFVESELWWKGPHLENISETESSLTQEEQEVLEKERKVVIHNFQTKKVENDFLTKYSSHFELCFIVSRCCHFLTQVMSRVIQRNANFKDKFEFIIMRMKNSENVVVRLVQNEVFIDDMRNLLNRKTLSPSSNIASLSPFVDGFGVLRVGGRLQNSTLSFNQKHPMILPANHQITTNIIRNAHELLLHGPENLTLSYLRNKFHVIRASDRVRHLIQKCVMCIRYAKERNEQLMGSLPEDRVSTNRPFLNTGVDYAGPILTREKGRGKKVHKSYISLFICMATKAMHLEVVSELSSQAFLAAFRRFVNRRGYCQTLYSDNGTNFVGSKRILDLELRKAELQWKGELQPEFERMKTEWSFNPAAAPHFGGLWEAGVKSVKTQLVKTIGNKSLTFEELTTILVQIEGILNSRPMCSVSNDPNSYIALTPAHFILGEALVTPPEPVLDSDAKTPVDRWIHLQTVRQQFWKSYVNDYLNRLQRRPKWLKTKTTFNINDLVLVKESNMAPTVWPLAKIVNTHPGRDGVVRVVTLQNANGRIFQRPTVKLRLLPTNELTD